MSALILRRSFACFAAVAALVAAEHHGTVKTGNLPLPGATITAVQGDKTMVTTTDERGAYHFADLPDGLWHIQASMLGFDGMSREVAVAPGAAAPEWQLKFLSESALVAAMGGTVKAPEPSPVRGAAAPRQTAQSFQRLAVAQSDTTASNNEGAIKTEELADLTQNAANSFIVQGSMSSAAGLASQNDWGPRPGMDGGPGMMGMMGVGGPGMGGPGMGGPGGDGPPAGGGGRGGGPGGGGPGMMMMGGGRGGPGGPGGGGPGGGGPGGPDGGGPGGPGGGGPPPGAPSWMRGPNARAFGNGRRDPRSMYQFGADFSLDNSALDARSFSVTGADVAKPAYATGRGGVNFGGPLRIPGLVSANRKILFSINYQFQRNHTGTTSTPVNMPTALERTGDFSQTVLQGSPVAIYDPTTGAPFPNNQIPGSRVSSTATALLKYFPSANLPFASRNYQTALDGLNHTQNLNSRVSNIKIGSNDRFGGGVGFQQSSSITPNMFQFIDTGSGRGINANVNWSHTFTRTVSNTVTYSFSRMSQTVDPYFAGRENVAAELGILGTSQQSSNWGPPNLSFANYGSLSDGNYSLSRNQTSAVGDSLTWTRGSHNLSFGGDYRRQQFNQLADNNGRGQYTFNGSATSAYVDGVALSGTGYDLADFLLGLPTTSSLRYGNPDKYFRGSLVDWFVNDDWRIAARFTLILGLRYEYQSPESEIYNRLVNLAVAPGWSAITAVVPGRINPDRNNFSPRLGFAWRPLTKGSLVVRGGFGMYYNTSVYNVIAGNMAQQPPFAESLSATNSLTDPFTLRSGFTAASTTAGTSTYALNPNYRVGYAQTWNLSIQHDLPFSMFGTIGYLGTKGTRLDQQFIPNSVAPGAAESALPHNYIYETSNGDSIYHAAQFQLNRRFHSGFMWHASYQFSKSIDNAGTGGRGQGNTPVAQNWLDLSAERALSSFDNRHNLSLQLQYSSGMGTTGGTLIPGWRGALLKDWTITNTFNLHSGNPLTATVGGNLSQVSGTAVSNTVRAEATGLAIDATGGTFNTAAFTQPAAGSWGDAGRNTIPGPAVFSMDSALGRVFRFGERRSADLQFQTTNILNHVTITNWGTAVGSSTYGEATNAAAMRKITVSLRFRF